MNQDRSSYFNADGIGKWNECESLEDHVHGLLRDIRAAGFAAPKSLVANPRTVARLILELGSAANYTDISMFGPTLTFEGVSIPTDPFAPSGYFFPIWDDWPAGPKMCGECGRPLPATTPIGGT
jgi:hypothetical protein